MNTRFFVSIENGDITIGGSSKGTFDSSNFPLNQDSSAFYCTSSAMDTNPLTIDPIIYSLKFRLHQENFSDPDKEVADFYLGSVSARVTVYKDKLVIQSALDYKCSAGPNMIPIDQVKVHKSEIVLSNNTWYDLKCIFHYPNRKVYAYLNGALVAEMKLGDHNTSNFNLIASDGREYAMSEASAMIQSRFFTGNVINWFLGGIEEYTEYQYFSILEPFDPNPSYTPPTVPNPFTVETSSGWY